MFLDFTAISVKRHWFLYLRKICVRIKSRKRRSGGTEHTFCAATNKDLFNIAKKQQIRTFHRLVKGSGVNALVRVTGLEPAQSCDHKNLNLTRLPIPPHPHIYVPNFFCAERTGPNPKFFNVLQSNVFNFNGLLLSRLYPDDGGGYALRPYRTAAAAVPVLTAGIPRLSRET